MAVKIAIIGLGIMGRRLLAQLSRREDFETVALWDPSAEAMAAAEAEAPGLGAASATAAIAAADLVYLACPPVPRAALALEAAAAGKALFLEKPFGTDVPASRDLAARLSASGVPVAVNFTQAASPAMRIVAGEAASGAMGDLVGMDIVVTYPAWPRAWQAAADWLRFRDEGGFTREVISHFVFFALRTLGPAQVVWARPSFPADPALCETAMLARLETAQGLPVSILASVGGAQPDRQEITVKGAARSHRIADFYAHQVSDGGPFAPIREYPEDPRTEALQAQLSALSEMMAGRPHPLATVAEALAVQEVVEAMLEGRG